MGHTEEIIMVAILLTLQQEIQTMDHSVCSSMQFRQLSTELQNEHQCIMLESLQGEIQQDKTLRDQQYSHVTGLLYNMQNRIQRNLGKLLTDGPGSAGATSSPALKGVPMARDCYELYHSGIEVSGIYPIKVPKRSMLNVQCDMSSGGGGWTLIQSRFRGELNFTRDWNDYAFGFGNVNAEFWLGNENIHQITTTKDYTLRIDLWDWDENHTVAYYDKFSVGSEDDGYQLNIEGYHGDAGDAFNYHNGMKFSTPDTDNDVWYGNCAKKDKSGWWFKACGFSSLNGVYHQGGRGSIAPDGVITGVTWYHWKEDYGYSMKRTRMMIKQKTALSVEREIRFNDLIHMETNKTDEEDNYP